MFHLWVYPDEEKDTLIQCQELIVPKKQRALVLQVGGSLGAYEAGDFQALYKNITKEDEKKGQEEKGRSLFDIVAGTSIGAINARNN